MTTKLEILLLSALCLLFAATAGSCTQNELEAPGLPDSAPGSKVLIKFNISTDHAQTASHTRLTMGEEGSANVAERILNPRDMRVMIFDGSGTLLQTVKPTSFEHNPSIYGDGYYSVSVAFDCSYFDSFNNDAIINFRIMILANLETIGGSYTSFPNYTTIPENIQETFVMQPDWLHSEEQGIPMFGYTTVSAKKSDLMSEGGGANVGSINLLRAMCKVEVRDEIVNAKTESDGLTYPRVLGVEMLSWRDHGYLAPTLIDYENGAYSANIHPTPPVEQTVNAVHIDGVYRFYCPEAKLQDMRFRVHAVTAPGEDPQYYDVSLSEFADEFESEDLVRNHIYRFNVHAINTIADLTATVSEWDEQVDEYELSNIVSMEPDGFLEWNFNQDDFSLSSVIYNGREEQLLSIHNGTMDYATGTFHILTPQGAVWKACFIPGENGVDAFEFVDTDASGAVIPGSARSVAEGIVNGPAVIHIRGKGSADAYRHVAELVVEVHTPDGIILHAPLTPSPHMSPRFIIYRENSF